ncbi:MAG TPA: hypothetical protein VFF16_15320, partial [Telluria sp.]|nr:hypothetical protein [Telluria sp.]
MKQKHCHPSAPRATALAIAAMLAAQPAFSQAQPEAAGEAQPAVSKADASANAAMEKVIVTGTRKVGTRVRDSAAPISVVDSSDLLQTGASNLFDAMTALVPSYNSQALAGRIGAMIRS